MMSKITPMKQFKPLTSLIFLISVLLVSWLVITFWDMMNPQDLVMKIIIALACVIGGMVVYIILNFLFLIVSFFIFMWIFQRRVRSAFEKMAGSSVKKDE